MAESRPVTAKSQKSEVKESELNEGEDIESTQPPPELIPAGFQENIMDQAVFQEEEFFGSTQDPPHQSQWHNFDTYAKNTIRMEYKKTSVAHLLISAIKHVSKKDSDKSTDLERRNNDLSDLQNLLTKGFNLPKENSEEKENISQNPVESTQDGKV